MIYVLSDVHTEREEFDFDKVKRNRTFSSKGTEDDILVLAGDIGTLDELTKLVMFLRFAQKHFKTIIYVPGNHEYDGTRSTEHTDTILRKLCDKLNSLEAIGTIYYLNKDIITTEGIVILGTTLWSKPHSLIEEPLRDHKIKRMTNKLRNKLFIDQKRWLQTNISKYLNLGKKVCVITHHAPSFKLLPQSDSPRNEQMYYASDSDSLLKGVDTWIFGHTHIPIATMINGTKLYNNPIGYEHEKIPDDMISIEL